MFIHWGIYAIPARGEWYRGSQKIKTEDYMKYFEEFDPVDYDPVSWAKAAKDAGMKYAVLTAKHHDGFCLFDSKLTDFKATNTPAGRDLIKEYVDAFRAEGLGVGIYYSIIDWNHPDYPHYEDANHPRRGDEDYKDYKYDFDNYLTYMHGQVKEICSNYGKIDLLWFDFSYDDLCGEAWKATELIKMVRGLQPDVIIDNRLEGTLDSSLLTGEPNYYSGDYISPEQLLPPVGFFDKNGNRVPWEACVTMNENWGYCWYDLNYKSAPMLIKKLVECVSKDGNLLLNVGPDAKGRIPAESLARLADIGDWMCKNSASIYDCGYADMEKPEWGRVTRNGNKLYFHVLEECIGLAPILGINSKDIVKVRRLSDGCELKVISDWRTQHYKDVVFVDMENNHAFNNLMHEVIEVILK
jgi:alpha-L-fucosidase